VYLNFLTDYSGINGIPHLSSQTDSSSTLPSFVPFKLRDNTWTITYLDRKLVLRMSDKIGQPISPCDNPTKSGSIGLFVRLGTGSGSGSQRSTGTQEQTYLLTNRHVVCSDDMTEDIGYPDPPGEDHGGRSHNKKAAAPASINIMQLGTDKYEEVMDTLKEELNLKQEYIDTTPLYQNYGDDTAGFPKPSTTYTRTLDELQCLRQFKHHCDALRSPAARRVGPVAFSPALGIRGGYRRDWALVSSAYQGANSSCIFHLRARDRNELRDRVRLEFSVTAEGHAGQNMLRDFISLNAVCSRETIERHFTVPLLSDGPIKANASNKTTVGDDKFLVYKYGPETGSTCGALNCISSRHHEMSGGIITDYCVISSENPFSVKGDSGSAVFGVLPVSAADLSDGSGGVPQRRGEDDAGPDAKAKAAKHDCTPVVIGIMWGGNDDDWKRHPHDDITYVTPIETILDDIEEYTGLPVVGLKRY
jgi:hypothetical protein